tara:strand:+ start:204 stop:440 length:237 start_codon:yes stop_codon:yes gene_type:complete
MRELQLKPPFVNTDGSRDNPFKGMGILLSVVSLIMLRYAIWKSKQSVKLTPNGFGGSNPPLSTGKCFLTITLKERKVK